MSNAQDLNEALSSNYLLVDMRVRSWGAKKTDRSASKQTLDANHATGDGGAFVKNLLAGASQELKEVHACANMLRSFVYSRTLAWSSSSDDGARRGQRALASSDAMNFLVELNSLKKEHDRAVLGLASVWPARMAEAMRNLGSLADAGDYPTAAELPGLFSIAVDINPIPAISDFSRLNVPATLAQALGNRYESQAQQQVANALKEMQERFLEELSRIATQLGKHGEGEKTRLFSTLITNMQGLVAMARSMNFTNNPKLSELADKIEAKLLQRPIEAYRDDVALASTVAAEAKALAMEAALDEIWQ